jgi:hypothetical protein
MRVEAFNQHVVVGGAVLTITNRAFNDASATRSACALPIVALLVAGSLLVEALRATINGCLRVGDRKRRVVRRSTVECEQTSATRNNRQQSRSRKMNLNKRVKRTLRETIESARAIPEAIREIDQHGMSSRQKEHAKAIT